MSQNCGNHPDWNFINRAPRDALSVRQRETGDSIVNQRPYIRETMHSALNLKCFIRVQLISATRGRASQPKVLAMVTDCSATCQQG